MKQIKQKKQQCRAWRTSSSLYLKLFMLLAVFGSSVGSAWAQTKQPNAGENNIGYGTPQGNGTFSDNWNYKWTASSYNLMNVFVFPGNNSDKLSNYSKMVYQVESCDGDEEYRIVFKDASDATIATVKRKTNGSGQEILFADVSDLNGHLDEVAVIAFGGSSNSGTVGFGNATLQLVTYTLAWEGTSAIPSGCRAWFTIDGDATEYTATKSGIPAGKSITLHATDDVDGQMFARFDIGSEPRWNNKTTSFNITSDVTVTPNFCGAYVFKVNVDGAGGTATIYDGTSDINGVKHKVWDGKVTSVTLTATPASGYAFDGWYEGSTKLSDENPYTINNPNESKVDKTYTAKFKSAATDFTVTWDPDIPSGALDAWYTLGDDASHIKETRTNVPAGTKVVFHASNGSSTAYAINGWREENAEGTWLGYGDTYTVASLSKDLNVWPEFREVHYYQANAGTGGSAKAYTNNETKADINGQKIFDWVGSATFEAIPDEGYVFDQWEDGNRENPRTVNGNERGVTYTHKASFFRECTCAGSKFDLAQQHAINQDLQHGKLTLNLNSTNWQYLDGTEYGSWVVGYKAAQTVSVSGGVPQNNYLKVVASADGYVIVKGMFGDGDENIIAVDASGNKVGGTDESSRTQGKEGSFSFQVTAGQTYYIYDPVSNYEKSFLYQSVEYMDIISSKTWDFAKTNMPSGTVYNDGGKDTSKANNNAWNSDADGYYPSMTEFVPAKDESNGDVAPLEGILFKGHVRVGSRTKGQIILFHTEGEANPGMIMIPVSRGQRIEIDGYTSKGGDQTLPFVNAEGNITYHQENSSAGFNYQLVGDNYVIATADGYATLSYLGNNKHIYINKITLSSTLEHINAFEDCPNGGTVFASVGVDTYTNPLAEESILPTNATVTWSSSNPTAVEVDAKTGKLNVKSLPNEGVVITATIKAPGFDDRQISYTVKLGYLHFDDITPTQELETNGAIAYWQPVHSGQSKTGDPCTANKPEGHVEWEIVSTTAKNASVTADNNGTGSWAITVFGRGETVVKATSGAVSATYTLTTTGGGFTETSVIYHFDKDASGNHIYQQTIPDVAVSEYVIQDAAGAIWQDWYNGKVTIGTDGTITGLPAYNDNKGGALTIKATTSGGKIFYYTLTIPYKKNVAADFNNWNFYRELDGKADGEVKSPLNYGYLIEYQNPGAADEVAEAANLDGVRYEEDSNANRNSRLQTNLKRRKRWMDGQDNAKVAGYTGTIDGRDARVYKYWDYTYKTMQWNKAATHITYTNEALFSYRASVNGENSAIIPRTAGLVFVCGKNKFGVNDGQTTTNITAASGKETHALNIREQDRSVLIKGDDSYFIIPGVTVGDYVVLHWYRHSDSAGDQFRVENGVDMDNKPINPNDVLRFTGSFYDNDYYGQTIIKAGEAGSYVNGDGVEVSDIKISMANSNWTEIYRVQVMPDYVSDLRVAWANVKLADPATVDGDNGAIKLVDWGGKYCYDLNEGLWLDRGPLSISRRDDAPNTYEEKDIYEMAPSKATNNTVDEENRIAVATLPTDLTGPNPIVYLNGVPGDTHTWNGWSPDFDVENCEGSHVHFLKKQLTTHCGTRVGYSTMAMTNFTGRGTLKVTMRVNTGWHANGKDRVEEPHYCLEKNEAYFAVGDYKVQTYPYTWDFRQYNMEGGKVEASDRTVEHFAVSRDEHYGEWDVDVNNYKLQTAKPVNPTFFYTGGGRDNKTKHNKFIFANNSRLVYDNASYGCGTGTTNQVREADGLRFTLNQTHNVSFNKTDHYWPDFIGTMNNAITLNAGYTDSNPGYMTVSDGSITVPEVDKDMYVFIRAAAKPTSVTIDGSEFVNNETRTNSYSVSYYSDQATVSMASGDIPSNVWVYKQTKEGKHDVVITPASGMPIYAIGVTNYFKPMTVGFVTEAGKEMRSTWSTEARAERIDYSNSGLFTNHNIKAFIANSTYNVNSEGRGVVRINEVKVVPSTDDNTTDNRGLLVCDLLTDETFDHDKLKNATIGDDYQYTPRPLIPLFVPACNLPDDDISGNRLVGIIWPTEAIPVQTENPYNYILTNRYWDKTTADGIVNNDPNAVQSGSYVNRAIDHISFYLLTDNAGLPRPNSAYLHLEGASSGAKANQFYLVIGGENGETVLEEIKLDEKEAVQSGIYTLTGRKLETLPTEKGIYIINGKKVFVK